MSLQVYHEANLAAGSSSSVTSDSATPFYIKLEESILQEMHQTLTRLLKEFNGNEAVTLDMTLFQLLDKLNNHPYMHILYAIANNVRRLW